MCFAGRVCRFAVYKLRKFIKIIFITSLLSLSGAIFLFVELPLAISNTGFIFPITHPRLSSNYGWRKHPISGQHKKHRGIDLAAPKDARVVAVRAGTVVFSSYHGGYGNLITLEHDDGYASLYGHLNSMEVKIGEKVKAGQLIGRVGSTGNSTGPHLHFEWRRNGEALNPLDVFPEIKARPEG